MFLKKSFFSFLLLFFLASLLAGKESKKPEEKAKGKKSEVHLQADFVRFNKKTNQLWAKGNVVIASREAKINAEEVLYHTKNETGTAKGNLVFTQEGTIIKGHRLRINMKEKEIFVEGNVYIRQEKKAIKKESKFKEEIGDVVEITCHQLFYRYGEKKGKLSGDVVVVSKDSKVFGQKADVDGEKNLIVVTEGIKVEKEDGEWLTADEVVINTEEDWVELRGNIRALIKVEEEKIPETKL